MNTASLETITHLAEQLPPEEQFQLVARIAEHLHQSQSAAKTKNSRRACAERGAESSRKIWTLKPN